MFDKKELKMLIIKTPQSEELVNPTILAEKVWYKTWEISQVRGNPGKGVKRFFPLLHDGEVQRLVDYFKGGYTVSIASKEEWSEAYLYADSCMTGKANEIYKLWEATKVHLFILRNPMGVIVARCLGKRSKRAPCYGSKSHILATVLRHFAGVDNEFGDWLLPHERREVGFIDYKKPVERLINVYETRQIVKVEYKDMLKNLKLELVPDLLKESQRTKVKSVLKVRAGYKSMRPYVDGHDNYRPQIYAAA